ncbi:hypothetical protein SAMN04489761_0257 [Tenacibaculum sp. MAR_2009_124]|uniref:hypothetical protein n=1 Tax=Tenacibaculum sp. MAR_2009_124 TaxID=1250059 RepID=UPI00089C5C81|nr:hypothetical protein [Tenacibaculum sp. MAR_2009_124]SEB37473.1 hypothetical protein SAMN04489761_0257 [Tenacibaculum sp. MAR_2009_124]
MSIYKINTLKNKYGVTEQKKETLDSLSNQVLDAQNEVAQLQAIVQSLTEKSNKLTNQLNLAEENKKQTLSNKELGDEVISKVKELDQLSETAVSEVEIANAKSKSCATQVKNLIDKLIYSSEVINKLANLVIRKKALNPLISDELVEMVSKAGTDANNAVALTLKALEAVFASQATILESNGSLVIGKEQAAKLYEYFIGQEVDNVENSIPDTNVQELLEVAHDVSVSTYSSALLASEDNTKQLNAAENDLNRATIKLSSLESGYAAAKAAALAS